MTSPIVKRLAENDICIGCGLCVSICPHDVLKMTWNQLGVYAPIEATPCIKECGLCLKVCPFSDNEDEDAIGNRLYGDVPKIHHHTEVGYHLASYVGYCEEHRLTGASGGVATWLLESLLKEGIVDRVICVAPTGDPDKLFAFQIFDTAQGLRSGSGSAYYPVELSTVIRRVLDEPGRYAITGLPCFIKAIRLAQANNAKLRERIVATVGLVCGQLKSKYFTEYVATLAGMEGKIGSVRYRGKSPDHPASNFHYIFKNTDGDEGRIFWKDGISNAWTNRWFTPTACNYCDDVFAECADVTCMDAWLPEYSMDSRGTSLVIARSPWAQELLARGTGTQLESISIERVVESQRGVCAIKRTHLAYRLYLERKFGKVRPVKRVTPRKPINPITRKEIVLKDRMREMSGRNWIALDRNLEAFLGSMQSEMRTLRLLHRTSRILVLPRSSLNYVKRKLS